MTADTKIHVSNKSIWAAGAAIIILTALIFFAGMKYQSFKPCDHNKPYEITDSTGGLWKVVPDGWSLVPIPDKRGRIYKKPTDQQG